MLQQMLKITLFRGIPEDRIKEIAIFSETVSFRAGELAIVEGNSEHHADLLLLIAGEVNVGTKFSPLPTAMELDLYAINNETYGEIAWILGGKRTAGVTCKTYCEFIRIDGDKLFAYCQTNPSVGFDLISRIAAVLAQRVVHLTNLARTKDLFS